MKKSKLLMPLTGIAAIGAFAPVVAMTSCHKYSIVESAMCGNVIDEETELMTNRIGIETLYDDNGDLKNEIELGIGAKLTKKVSEIERGHVIKRIINKAGKEGETGTPFYVAAAEKQLVGGQQIADKEWFTEDAVTLTVNPERIAELTKEGASVTEEAFQFTITYEEFESDTSTTSIGKQDVTYTVYACPK